MIERKSYLKNTGYLLAANALVLGVGFLARPFVARLLGPEEYGLFALTLGTGTAIGGYLLFSLNAGLLYHVARNPKKAGEFNSTTLAFLAISSAALFPPALLVVGWLAPALGFYGFLAAFLLAFSTKALHILQAMQQGLKKFKQFSSAHVTSSLLAAIASVIGASFFSNGVTAVFLRALAILLVAVGGLIYLNRFGRMTRKAFDEMWIYSKPITFAAFASTLIVVVDKYFLAAFSSMSSLGRYDISLALVSAILPFTVSLTMAMLPEVARHPEKILSYYPRISIANTAFLSAFGLTLYYYADIIINVLLGSEYVAGAVPLLRILALALPAMSFLGLNSSVYCAIGKPKASAFFAASLVITNIVFNALLVPDYGAKGAAVATLCTYFVIAVASTVMLWRRVRVGIRKTVLQLALFALFAAGYWLLDDPGFTVKTLLLLAFALATLALQRKMAAEVIETVKEFLPAK